MRIPNELLKLVVFICGTSEQRRTCDCTGFMVGVRSALFPEHVASCYLVTAADCVRHRKRLTARLNLRNGRAEHVPLSDQWLFQDDLAVDVAVLPFEPPPDRFDHSPIPSEMFALSPVISELGIGPGDDLVMVGLVTRVPGRAKNIPITRVGSIAAMPTEPFLDEHKHSFDAYLA